MRNCEAISALAGAGKTYQLTTRYLALLSQGVAPESILAITFTRKAAGEIFDRIVGRLARAILDPRERETLQKDLRQTLDQADFEVTERALSEWLHKVIRAMPRLRIGTIDSLFVGMAQAFAFELGLPSCMDIMQGSLLALAQEDALDATMAEAQAGDPSAAWISEVFGLVTQQQAKSVRKTLLNLAREAHSLYLENPDETQWGDPRQIWPNGSWWNTAPATPPSALAEEILRAVEESSASSNRYVQAWEKALAALQNGDWSSNDKLLTYLLDHWETLPREGGWFAYCGTEYAIGAKLAQQLRELAAPAVREAIERLLSRARGAYRLAAAYERVYQQRVRSAGRLSFQDVQHVLLRAAESGVKLDIDYRLDGRFDHWMLDEFQDTSRRQWEILRNLVDELLQSADRTRSFFYVGDAKQAIYGWRGGDSTLFEEVPKHYAGMFPAEPTVLKVCWRSSPIILDAVNQLFDPDNLALQLQAYPHEVERWKRHWTRHQPAEKNRDLPGCVEVRTVFQQKAGQQDNGAPAAIAETCGIIKDLRENGVASIAVLVRLNSFGDKVADAIRAEGIPVLREVNPSLLDNGIISALLSLFHFADHPGDSFSFAHLRMAGLGPALEQLFHLRLADRLMDGRAAGDELAARLRERAAAEGVSGLCAQIIRTMYQATDGWPTDKFAAVRLRQLMLVAADFDRLYQKGLSDFATYAAEVSVKDPVATSGVVVMTVHKAKGLEFDAVILPDLSGTDRQMTHLETGNLAVFEVSEEEAAETGKQPGWVLPIPSQKLAQLDPVLNQFRQKTARRRLYEELCLLYVAVTRARQGLYFVIPAARDKNNDSEKNAANLYPADLVRATFRAKANKDESEPAAGAPGAAAYRHGRADWFRAAGARAEPISPERDQPFKPRAEIRSEVRRRLLASTPSGSEEAARPTAEHLFDAGRRRGAQRGTIVHELFQQVVWYTPDAAAQIADAYRAAAPVAALDVVNEAVEEFLRAMRSDEVQALLKQPSPRAEVWNEQAFELAEQDRWVTGRMDRVVVERDAAGKIIAATVVDFKTDRLSSDEELRRHVAAYRPQMEWYARAMAKLTGLPQNAVHTRLLFTYRPEVVSVT
jgi:ATP-dependent helicase/nuclease subunit A